MPHVESNTTVRPMKICKPDAVRLIGGSRCILEGCCKVRLPSDATCRIEHYSVDRTGAVLVPVQCQVAAGEAAAGGPISGDSTSTSTVLHSDYGRTLVTFTRY